MLKFLQRFWIAFPTILVVIALAIPVLRHPGHARQKLETEEGLSGALEALNSWAAERAYPNHVIPDIGQAAAFEEMRFAKVQAVATLDPIDHLVSPWASIGPNNIGGRTLCLALQPGNPSVMYAGSANGGLWKSTTGGVGADAWDYVETGYPVSAVSTIAIDPKNVNVMYIGTGEVYQYQNSIGGDVYRTTRGSYGIGILKTTDGGLTWTKSLNWTLNQTRGVWSIRVNPNNSNIVYAATTEGIYKSLNAGTSWNVSLNVIMGVDLRIHPTAPETVYASCGNFGSAGNGLYRTTNGGTSWIKLTTGLPVSWTGKALLDISPVTTSTVYASIGNSGAGLGLYRSTNNGSTWSLMNSTDYPTYQGWYSHWVLCSANNINTLWVGGIDIWKSTNAGTNLTQVSDWTQIFFGTPQPGQPGGGPQYAHADQHFSLRHPTDPNTFFVCSDGGVFKTTDGGVTYTGLNGGYVTTQFYQGFTNSNLTPNYAIGGLQDNLTAVYEGTVAWRRVIGGDGCWTAIRPDNDLTVYGAAQYLDIYRSYTSGANEDWASIAPPDPGGTTSFVAPYVLCPSSPARLYAGRGLIYRSDNEGTSWTAMNGGVSIDGTNPAFSMAVSPTNANVVYVITAPNGTRGKLFRSLNGGTSWTDITGILPDRYLSDIVIDPSNENRLYVSVLGFGTSHLFRSENQGGLWTDIGAGLPDVPTSAVEVDPARPYVIYVGDDLGVYVSPNNAANWHLFTSGMPTASVNDLKISGPAGKIRAATHGNGVYERDLLDVTFTGIPGDDHHSRGPEMTLAPNPLRGAGRITFSLQESGHVRLALYDVAGREARVLLDEERGPGTQTVAFERRGLAAGVYFLALKSAEGRSLTRVVVTQ